MKPLKIHKVASVKRGRERGHPQEENLQQPL